MPAVIRSSADWQGKKTRKKKHKRTTGGGKNKTFHGGVLEGSNPGCVDFQDVWCGPGIGFSADTAASVDCVVARKNVSARGKIDVDKITHREVFSFLQCLIFFSSDLVPKSVENFSLFFHLPLLVVALQLRTMVAFYEQPALMFIFPFLTPTK